MCLIPRDSHRITWSLKLPASCYLLCNLRNRNISLLLLSLHLVLPIKLCLGTTQVVAWRDLKLTRHQWHHRDRVHRHPFKEINIKSIRMRFHQEWWQLLEAAPSRIAAESQSSGYCPFKLFATPVRPPFKRRSAIDLVEAVGGEHREG